MAEYSDIINGVDSSLESFDKEALKAQKRIMEKIQLLAKDLEVDSAGNIKTTIANLKKINSIKAEISRIVCDDRYKEAVTKFCESFQKVYDRQNKYYKEHFAEATLSETAAKKQKLLGQMAIDNTIEGLTGAGVNAQITDKLTDMLKRSVTSGALWTDMVAEMRSYLDPDGDGTGAFAKYAKTYATTAMGQFTGQNNKLMTDALDTEWYMYVGSDIETTREFCQHLTKKKYVHVSEIPEILKGHIDGHECAIYAKTGLPQGMIEGTTPENFQVNVGGWNCRHQLLPVAEEAVPEDIRRKFQKEYQKAEKTPFEIWYDEHIGYLMANRRQIELVGLDIPSRNDPDWINRTKPDLDEEFIDYKVMIEGLDMMLAEDKNKLSALRIYAYTNGAKNMVKVLDSEIIKWDIKNVTRQMISYKFFDNRYEELKKQVEEEISSAKISQKPTMLERVQKAIADVGGAVKQESLRFAFAQSLELLANKLGVERGDPMTYEQADKQSTNPLYGTERGYGINCQTCAPAYMLRLQGFNITAKSNRDGSKLDYLSRHWGSCWKNIDGTGAKIITFAGWMQSKGYKQMNAKRYREFFDDKCAEVGIYEVGLSWKGGGGHCTIIERTPDGILRYIEPQRSNYGDPYRDINYLCERMTTKPDDFSWTISGFDQSDGVIKIDDKVFNDEYAEIFTKGH